MTDRALSSRTTSVSGHAVPDAHFPNIDFRPEKIRVTFSLTISIPTPAAYDRLKSTVLRFKTWIEKRGAIGVEFNVTHLN